MAKKISPVGALLKLRAQARDLIASSSVVLVPGSDLPPEYDTFIGDVVRHYASDLSDQHRALLERLEQVADSKLTHDVDDHCGRTMVVYSEAGYYAGLAMGLELAALTGGAR